MYIYVYMYIYIYVHTYVYTCILLRSLFYVERLYVCVNICMCVCVCVCPYTHTQYDRSLSSTDHNSRLHTYIHKYIIHTHKQTHRERERERERENLSSTIKNSSRRVLGHLPCPRLLLHLRSLTQHRIPHQHHLLNHSCKLMREGSHQVLHPIWQFVGVKRRQRWRWRCPSRSGGRHVCLCAGLPPALTKS